MATTLACYTENGCPEQFPNGDEGQSLEIVGGVPTWVDPVVGTVSVVTDNGDGTYTHDDGNGNLTIIDTNGDTAQFVTASALTSTIVDDAINELANVQEGWRIVGAAGAGAAAAEPTRDDDLSVSDDVQHIGGVLVGGIVGDALGEFAGRTTLHSMGHALIENDTFAGLDFFNPDGAGNEKYWILAASTGVGPNRGQMRMSARLDNNAFANTVWDMGREGNVSNNDVTANFFIQGAQHVQFFLDGVGTSLTVAPVAVVDPAITAHWSKRVPAVVGNAEHFVMDGGGAVTQLSSHSETIAGLLGLTGMAYSINSYNVFSGYGEGVDPVSGRKVIYSIDDGTYEVIAADGTTVESSGQNDNLAYGENNHAPMRTLGFFGERGEEFWDHVQGETEKKTDERIAEWDKLAGEIGEEEAKKQLGERPLPHAKQPIPDRVKDQLARKPKGRG